MFKAIKEFFAGKKADVAAEPTAPYKVEPPVVAAAVNQAASDNTAAPAPKKSPAPRARKQSGSGKPRAKKPAAKKPTPTP